MTRNPAAVVAVAIAAASASASTALAQESAVPDPDRTDWSLQLEGGSEYDSNVHRVERRESVIGSPLARLGARHRLAWRRTPRERLTLASHGGLKVFTRETGQTENVAVLSADGGYEWGLPARGLILGLSGNYYDAIPYQLSDAEDDDGLGRHFRIGQGAASATLVGPRGHRVTALAGYRAFHYKPTEDLDWQGEHVGL
ncbi:MAG TPA: hypothetical protein VNO33_19060, partial [Kofleriaceae bacterium]|nr:hypothetical protein [Kofleriaceae bacterium]